MSALDVNNKYKKTRLFCFDGASNMVTSGFVSRRGFILLKLISFLLAILVASNCNAAPDCMTSKEVARLLRANGLKQYGWIGIDGVEAGRQSQSYIAYVNFKTGKYLSIKKVGKCLSEPVFLTEEEYYERFQFEGEEECDGC